MIQRWVRRDPKRTLSDVHALLEDYQAKQPTSDKRLKGKFALTEGSVQGFEKRMNAARCMLRLYGYPSGQLGCRSSGRFLQQPLEFANRSVMVALCIQVDDQQAVQANAPLARAVQR